MNGEKRPERKIAVEGRFIKWLDNFWYHYKWVVIGVAVAAIVLAVCIAQSCTKEKKDISIVYAGPVALSVSEQVQMEELMSQLLPKDLDENGENVARITTYHIYSEEQIKKITAQTDADGRPLEIDRNQNTSMYSTYSGYLQTGESSIYLLDPWLYQNLLETNGVRPLAEVFGQVPEGAIDAYGIRLGDTDLYEEYDVLKLLPEDTVICLMKSFVMGRSSNEEMYAFEVETFRAIVTYTSEEE